MKAPSRKFLSFVLSAVLLLTLAQPAAASIALGDDLSARTEPLHRGVELAEETFWSNTYSDLRQENYVVYTPGTVVTPIVTYGDYVTATTTVSAAAKTLEEQGLRVVAGINGDYYGVTNGVPLGSVMTQGVLRVAAAGNYAAGFRADGTAVLGAPELKLRAESAAGGFDIAAVNQVRYSYGGIFLYTYDFNARRSTGTNAAGYDVVCSAADGRLSIGETLTLTVEEILPEATDTTVEEGKYVLTANLLSGEETVAPLRALSVGDTLTVTVTAADEGWNDVEYMVGALYRLVADGAVCEGLEAGAAPRTAIGQRADGSVVFYTIDGRRSGHSIGATLTQVAARMVELGCVTALSLDGGGSTTMCVTLPGEAAAGVYNTPSEGRPRAVSNHVFLVAPNEPSGELDHISLRAESNRALAGARVTLSAAAIDTNYLRMELPVALASDRGSLYEEEALGTVLGTPKESGSVTVGAKAGGKYATVTVHVVETPDEIRLRRDGSALTALRVSPGESVELTAQAYHNHLRLTAQNDCFVWSADGGVGAVDENGVFTAADHVAYGTLTVAAGETALTLPVYVSAEPLALLDGFEGEQAVLTANTDKNYVRFGFASARWDYAAERAPEETRDVILSVERSDTVPDGYDRVSLWVYGDGSGARLALTTSAAAAAAGTVASDTETAAEMTGTVETEAAAIDFAGWKRLSFALPTGTKTIAGFVLHTQEGVSGTLYLDQMTASCGEGAADSTAPDIALTLSEDGTALTGKVFDTVDGGSLPTLRVTLDGKALAYTYDHQTGALRAALPAADSAVHRLTVTAGDASGNLARRSLAIEPEGLNAAFADTAGHRSIAAVSYLRANGVTNGDGEGNFHPDSSITRQEFAVLLYRWLAPEDDFSTVEMPFADGGDISGWARDGIRAMYAMGVTKGSEDLHGRLCFYPKATISRQEVVTMLGRLLELGYTAPEQTFADGEAVASWARSHIFTLCAVGALSPNEDGTIRPTEAITRAQVAELLYGLS